MLDPRRERKVVTVLFADLVGFTARADRHMASRTTPVESLSSPLSPAVVLAALAAALEAG